MSTQHFSSNISQLEVDHYTPLKNTEDSPIQGQMKFDKEIEIKIADIVEPELDSALISQTEQNNCKSMHEDNLEIEDIKSDIEQLQ